MKPHEIAYKVASSHYDRKLRDFAKDLIIAYEESLRPNLRKDREPIAEVLDSYAIPLWQASSAIGYLNRHLRSLKDKPKFSVASIKCAENDIDDALTEWLNADLSRSVQYFSILPRGENLMITIIYVRDDTEEASASTAGIA